MDATKQKAEQANRFESTIAALVAHPTRIVSYVILNERVASPTEIAKVIGKEVGHVGYHCRKLEAMGLIEEVDAVAVRGAVEHRFAAVKRPIVGDTDWARMTPEQRDSLTRLTLQLLVADAAAAVDAGTFDKRLNRFLVRSLHQVDEVGFAELHDLDEHRYMETLEIEARSAERQAAEPDREMIPIETFAAFYERAPKPTWPRV